MAIADRYTRRHTNDRPIDNRQVAQRDRDRVLYSSALRRLAGVTQVVAASEGHVFHNRLTHTLKVAQVGRRLAEKLLRPFEEAQHAKLPPLDPDVVETAALVHDIGHPPFGHVAEEQLHTLMRGVARPKAAPDGNSTEPVYDADDGFEGNAQSFRTVTTLAAIDRGFAGLNLCAASLAASLKYPWRHQPAAPEDKAFRKWGSYSTEEDDFRFALGLQPPDAIPTATTGQPTLEAQVMDWADDITYAVHDAEDLYRAGLVPLDRLAALPGER